MTTVVMHQSFVTMAPYPQGIAETKHFLHHSPAKSPALRGQAESICSALCPLSFTATAVASLFKKVTVLVLPLHCGDDPKVIAPHLVPAIPCPTPRVWGV